MKLRYFLPLLAYLIPTLVIGFGSVIPGSCIDGFNALTIGFVASIVGTCLTYVSGVWTVARDRSPDMRAPRLRTPEPPRA